MPPSSIARWNSPHPGPTVNAGSDIVLEIHYTTNGKEQKDQTKLGLSFSKEPRRRRARARWTVPNEMTLLNLTPHMHL